MEKLVKSINVKNGRFNTIEVTLSYNKGGVNYFTGNREKRGIYLSVTPVNKVDGFKEYTAFSGVKSCIKEMKRFSKKTFDNIKIDEELLNTMIKDVLMANNLNV